MAQKNGGIMLEADYPYKGYKGTCKSDSSKYEGMKINGWKKLGDSSSTWSCVDEDEVKEFLYETGPLAIALNADPLQTYSSGILDLTSARCPSSGINHAVLLVGLMYMMCKVNLVLKQEEEEMNKVNKEGIDDAIGDAEEVLNDITNVA